MKTILEELYEGNIIPYERIVSVDPEYLPLNKRISEALDAWREKLSKGDFDLLQALFELRGESIAMENSASFVYGFKLGAVIMLEVLGDRGK